MKIVFIRHGKTKGNLEKRYIGKTDEPLSKEGIKEIENNSYPYCEAVISSGMKRCNETAEIIYPNKEYKIYEGLKECDFGLFENKNYDELKDNAYYKKWLESMGQIPFPEGEGHKEFCDRCSLAFEKAINDNKNYNSIAFVIHGGSIMAIAERLYEKESSFYDWQIANGKYLYFDLSYENDKIILK